jgi:hypothetical protein
MGAVAGVASLTDVSFLWHNVVGVVVVVVVGMALSVTDQGRRPGPNGRSQE